MKPLTEQDIRRRIEASSAPIQLDPGLAVEQRIAGLESRLVSFLDEVLRGQVSS